MLERAGVRVSATALAATALNTTARRGARASAAVLLLALALLFIGGSTVWAAPTPPPDGTVTTEAPTPPPDPDAPVDPSEPGEPGDPGVSPEPELTPSPEPEPSEPAPSEEPSPAPEETPKPEGGETVFVPGLPPVVSSSDTSWLSIGIAVAAILISLAIAALIVRRRPAPAASIPFRQDQNLASSDELLGALTTVGETMIDSGYPVTMVKAALEDLALVNDAPDAEVVVFPTALLVSVPDGAKTLTKVVSAGSASYLLHQVDAVDRVIEEGRRSPSSARWVRAQLAQAVASPAPFTPLQRVAAYALASVGISVLLGASWAGVAVSAALGLAVGAALLSSERVPSSYRVLVTVLAALGVSMVVFLLARTSVDPGVLPSLVAPLVILLPGGLLTTAVIELATGHIMAGAARLAAGAMRLVLLAVGILGAAALVGVPELEFTGADEPLGPIAPWIAVAVFGFGIAVHQCARPQSIAWIILVLYVAYGAQVLGNIFFGGVLSALVGAAAMTPVAVFVARQRSGPPAIVSFLPAFWLLVPGALGLVGVTAILDGDSSGLNTLSTTIATMVAIALGVLIGLAATRLLGAGARRMLRKP